MIKPELIAELMLQPALEVLGGPCKAWRRKVRLFSYGLLPEKAEPEVISHVRACSACRLFLLQCFNIQGQVSAALRAKGAGSPGLQGRAAPETVSRLGSAEDASQERLSAPEKKAPPQKRAPQSIKTDRSDVRKRRGENGKH